MDTLPDLRFKHVSIKSSHGSSSSNYADHVFRRRMAFLIGLLALWALLRTGLLVADFVGDTTPSKKDLAIQLYGAERVAEGRGFARLSSLVSLRVFCKVGILLFLMRYGSYKKLYDWLDTRVPAGQWLVELLAAAAFFLILEFVNLPFNLAYYLILRGHGLIGADYSFLYYLDFAAILRSGARFVLALSLIILLARKFPRSWLLWLILVPLPYGLVSNMLNLNPEPSMARATKLTEGPLHEEIRRLADAAYITDTLDVYIEESADASDYLMARVRMPDDGHWILTLSQNLVDSLTLEEAATVVAHELGHIRYMSTLEKWLPLLGYYVFACMVFVVHRRCHGIKALRFEELASAANLPLVMLMLTVASFFGQPVKNWMSRQGEYRSDDFAIELTAQPEAYVSALIKLGNDRYRDFLEDPLNVFWYSSHPPIVERIERVRSAERARVPDGS